MSEATIMSGMQTAIRAMSEFASADVVINDWSVLDGPVSGAPYVIIATSDEFMSRQDAPTAVTTWDLNVILFEHFTDWNTTLTNLRTRRQAIIDKINSSDIRSAGGLEAVDVQEIRAAGPIIPWFDPDIDPELMYEADPLYLVCPMILVCEEF